MPSKAKRPCGYPGCHNLTIEGYCQEHQQEKRSYERYRGTAASRGYDSKWKKARDYFLMKHPYCVDCEKEGVLAAANVVDHIIPHKGDKKLFWDRNNWQPLCTMHHNRKTAKEDMGAWR